MVFVRIACAGGEAERVDLSRAEVGHVQVAGLEGIPSLVSEVPGRRAKQKLS